MEGRIIGRGLLAGAVAGLFAFVYARLFVEPLIERAITFEEGRGHAEASMGGLHEHHMELFTRDVQSWAGMGFGVLAFGVAMGGLFAVAFVVAYSRFPGLSARSLSALLAAVAFVAVFLVPFLKYPASPPSVGAAETIRERSGLYLLMVLLSVACAAGALWLGRRLAPRLGTWNATLTALGAYSVTVALAMWALPGTAETPQPLTGPDGGIGYPGFPADDLYQFRVHAVGTQVVMWATIGLLFGVLVSRLLESGRRQHIAA